MSSVILDPFFSLTPLEGRDFSTKGVPPPFKKSLDTQNFQSHIRVIVWLSTMRSQSTKYLKTVKDGDLNAPLHGTLRPTANSIPP